MRALFRGNVADDLDLVTLINANHPFG